MKDLDTVAKTKVQRKLNKHSFFKSVQWEKVLDRTYEAPFIPSINIEKIKNYLQRKGCKIGINRKKNDKYGLLAETELPTKVKMAVEKYNNEFD